MQIGENFSLALLCSQSALSIQEKNSLGIIVDS